MSSRPRRSTARTSLPKQQIELSGDEYEEEDALPVDNDSESDDIRPSGTQKGRKRGRKARDDTEEEASDDEAQEADEPEEIDERNHIFKLSDELIEMVLAGLESPANFSLTCTRFRAISLQTNVVCKYFWSRYDCAALMHLMAYGRLATIRNIEALRSKGALLPRYLIQKLFADWENGRGHNFRQQFMHAFNDEDGPRFNILTMASYRVTPFSTLSYLFAAANDKWGDDLYPTRPGRSDIDELTDLFRRRADMLDGGMRDEESKTANLDEIKTFIKHTQICIGPTERTARGEFIRCSAIDDASLDLCKDLGVAMQGDYSAEIISARMTKATTDIDALDTLRALQAKWPSFVVEERCIKKCMRQPFSESTVDAFYQLFADGHLYLNLPDFLIEIMRKNSCRPFGSLPFRWTKALVKKFRLQVPATDEASVYLLACALAHIQEEVVGDEEGGIAEALEAFDISNAEPAVWARYLSLAWSLDTSASLGRVLEFLAQRDQDLSESIKAATVEALFDSPCSGHGLIIFHACCNDFHDQAREAVLSRWIDIDSLEPRQKPPPFFSPLCQAASINLAARRYLTWQERNSLDHKDCMNQTWRGPASQLEFYAVELAIANEPERGTNEDISTARWIFETFCDDREVLDVLFQHALLANDDSMVSALTGRGLVLQEHHVALLAKLSRHGAMKGLLEFCYSQNYTKSHADELPAAESDYAGRKYSRYNRSFRSTKQNEITKDNLTSLKKWRVEFQNWSETIADMTVARRKRRRTGDPAVRKPTIHANIDRDLKRLGAKIGVVERGIEAAKDKAKKEKKRAAKKSSGMPKVPKNSKANAIESSDRESADE